MGKWHKINGLDVYVEYGYVVRGMKRDINGNLVPARVYRYSKKQNAWVIEEKITSTAFRSGLANGTVKLF